MRPGEDCLGCHAERGDAPAGTAAGTRYASSSAEAGAGVEGLSVRIVDSRGADFTVRTNAAGNFYTAKPLTFPLYVAVVRDGVTRWMMRPVD